MSEIMKKMEHKEAKKFETKKLRADLRQIPYITRKKKPKPKKRSVTDSNFVYKAQP